MLVALAVFVGLYSFVVYAPSLALLPTRPLKGDPAGGERPRLTSCFCAYCEEQVVPLKLQNLRLLRARHPDLEILASPRQRLEWPRFVSFSHDRNGADIWQRCRDLTALGFVLTNASRHRDKNPQHGEPPWHEIDLHRTVDAACWRRAWSVVQGAFGVLCLYQ